MTSATVASQFDSFAKVQFFGDSVFSIRNENDAAAVCGRRSNRLLQSTSVIGLSISHGTVVLNVEEVGLRRLADLIVGILKSRQLLVILMLAKQRATAEDLGLTGHCAVNEFSDSISNRDRTFSALDVCGVHLVVGAILSPDAILSSLQSASHDPKAFGVIDVQGSAAIGDGEVGQLAAGIISRDAAFDVEPFLIPGDRRESGLEAIHLVNMETRSVLAHIGGMRTALGRTSRQLGPDPVVR